MMKNLPSPEYLHKCLRYDAATGALTWCSRPQDHFANKQAWKRWNNIFSGTEAGRLHHKGYRQVKINGRQYLAHRIIWAMFHGVWPEGQIDHIDGDRLNNRISNLRDVEQRINQRNAKMQSNNTSGVNGVSWGKRRQKWIAQITIDGKQKYLGCFDTVEDAAAARKAADVENGFTARHGEAAFDGMARSLLILRGKGLIG